MHVLWEYCMLIETKNIWLSYCESYLPWNKKHIFTCSEWVWRLSLHHGKIIKGIGWAFFFLIILLHCAKIISHSSHCVFSQCKETGQWHTLPTVPQTKWSGGKGWSKDRFEKNPTRSGSLCLLVILLGGFKRPLKLSWAGPWAAIAAW